VPGNPTRNGYPIIYHGSAAVDPAWPQDRDSSYPGRSLGGSRCFPTIALGTVQEDPGEVSRGHSTPLVGGRPKS
jgi:hypothetical protein